MSRLLVNFRPRVSVCLPNFQNRTYLPARIDTIIGQTFGDWELVVYDNHSDDGAWEYLTERAQAEPRMHIAQAPRLGMYANWNNCISAARGEYIYVATSDDTMAPDCLEKLVGALERESGCGMAHCLLQEIDENGDEIVPAQWPTDNQAVSFGFDLSRRHVRPAGLDTIYNCLFGTVYTSITQLLIRRAVFDRAGLFDPRWGSIGDYHWQIKATAVAATLHLPETLATWRRHPEQATQAERLKLGVARGIYRQLLTSALADLSALDGLPHELADRLGRSGLWDRLTFDEFMSARALASNSAEKLRGSLAAVGRNPRSLGPIIRARLTSGVDRRAAAMREAQQLARAMNLEVRDAKTAAGLGAG